MYEGVWLDDVAKCGTMKDFDRDNASEPTQYPIPKVNTHYTYTVFFPHFLPMFNWNTFPENVNIFLLNSYAE